MAQLKVVITEHARQRLQQDRQGGITLEDIVSAAYSIPGRIPSATRFRSFVAASGRSFDLVAKDTRVGRLVITVIGK
ncbi:hypothetical protein [Gelria sp. Kuro-4]|jgi:hypothetical protein|uniref:hypothetical protein n=1 Tax=Gelria sp. Kuro-4 TaxID=2796927 RepID=UPI001BEE3ED5|nr:hypothetical protein [Gelria sp. Kuro-4]BCV24979.1 hypothetical protein kuro4_17520 [Gelria sp. Kuro-4]